MDEARVKLKVVNLFGAPGTGKSATRSGLFWLMKAKGMSVEEVSEYAKYLVLSNRAWQLERDQLYVLAQQHHKMLILDGVYEFGVTDSPLLLASFYAQKATTPQSFHALCSEYDQGFDNLNVFLRRDLMSGRFETEGRLHGAEESERIAERQKEFLSKRGVSWTEVDVDHKTPWSLVDLVEARWPGSVPAGGPGVPGLAPSGSAA